MRRLWYGLVLTFVFLFVECQTIGAGDVDAKPRLTTDSVHNKTGAKNRESINLPSIAILVPVSSKDVSFTSFNETLPLFATLLPSLVQSLDCGFRYIAVVGYPEHDHFYDSQQGQELTIQWFQEAVADVLEIRGISIRLELVRVDKHPEQAGAGLVVNTIARKAYSIGADFMYRLSEDASCFGRWPFIFVDTLTLSLGIQPGTQLLGVVGPASTFAPKDDILTHHFVHRTHMEVFQMDFYPLKVLSSEYLMDVWLSSVYGSDKTFKMARTRVVMSHHPANAMDVSVLDVIARSQSQISQWLSTKGLPPGMYARASAAKPVLGASACLVLNKLPRYPNVVMECVPGGWEMSTRAKYCAVTRKQYGVVPRKSKGSLSKAQLVTWKEHQCGNLFHPWYDYSHAPKSRAAVQSGKASTTSFHALPLPDCLEHNEKKRAQAGAVPPPPEPLIAVLAGSTSRSETDPSNATLSVFTIMLPSLLRSLDCGFRYVVVIGYDKGDKFYDSEKKHMHAVLEHRGISMQLELVKVNNLVKKPGPVFVEIARKAYDIGADFMYRVNDDTEFHGKWPKLYSETLMNLSKPYGVIGPRCTPTQNRILTHDFVHRTHMEIFNMQYYPPELVDWWMDDWVSSVYGISRTFMSKDVTVIHHVQYHGRRYDVNASNEQLLAPLVRQGSDRVSSWMKRPENNIGAKDISAFTREGRAGFKYKLRYIDSSGGVEEYFQIGGKKGSKTAPERAEGAIFTLQPLSRCGNESDATVPVHDGPLVAVLLATTTRTEPYPSPSTLSLFTLMLPSLIRSVDCGFRYVVVIGYDTDDFYYDSPEGQREVSVWFHKAVLIPMKSRGISMQLELVKVDNALQKPGPVFVEIARKAYDIGADFMYRVNDDTEFHGKWPKLYSETLMNLTKPYGVIGPRCTTKQNHLLTHDFVHRTHMEIFNMQYYPPELDWWMDDWVSSVYGINRTFVSKDVTVIHHVKYHGQRYKADVSFRSLVDQVSTSSKHQLFSWTMQPRNEVGADVIIEMQANIDSNSSAPASDKLRYISKGGLVEAYSKMEDDTPIKNNAKKKPSGIRKSVRAVKKSGKKLSKPTTFQKLPLPACVSENSKYSMAAMPLIAILAGSTSRNEANPSNGTLSVFTIMLPSLLRSLDCGFRYVVVIGYDKGDKFYDSEKGLASVHSWFDHSVTSVMKRVGIVANLELVMVNNLVKKPGPVFVEIARKAYDIGADFMYRVNDDTEFHGKWPKLYSETLMRLSKPYGVIGPRCTTTQNRILTHDFVHRTHMEIFNMQYYPPELVDWWMDDWVSSVYGISRTFMSKDVTVIHHVKYHGRRYDVNASNEQLLQPLVETAKDQIVAWMKRPENNIAVNEIAAFSHERAMKNVDKLTYVTRTGKFEKYYQIKEKQEVARTADQAKQKSFQKKYVPPKKVAGATASASAGASASKAVVSILRP